MLMLLLEHKSARSFFGAPISYNTTACKSYEHRIAITTEYTCSCIDEWRKVETVFEVIKRIHLICNLIERGHSNKNILLPALLNFVANCN